MENSKAPFINDEMFISHFMALCEQKKQDIKDSYKSRNDYTRTIKGIIKEIISECNLKFYPEFYDVDYTGWDCKQPHYSDLNINIYDWKLWCAIEHENDSKDWTYEVAKLAFIRCPLRVVIGYSENIERDKDESRLAIAARSLSDGKYIDESDSFVVILGNKSYDNELGANYKPYVYSKIKNSFIEIKDWNSFE